MQQFPHAFSTPLRYPGGKGALCGFIKSLMVQNSLLDGHYAELYAGGAGIAWPLLFEEYVQHVHINDISRPIVAFWQSVLNETEGLCRLVRDTPVTMAEWRRQRRVQADPGNHSSLKLGFSTFFLNRTNRSGILKGGVIGGKSQAGKWKLDARFNKDDLVARIQRIARYKSRVSVYNCDASEFIRDILPKLPVKLLLYLDPPYYVKGAGLYENHYVHGDHEEIAELVSDRIRQPWIVSYDDAPQIALLYKGYRCLRYTLSYSAQTKYSGSEIMFFADGLVLPKAVGIRHCGN